MQFERFYSLNNRVVGSFGSGIIATLTSSRSRISANSSKSGETPVEVLV
jgi:hypothetical protein